MILKISICFVKMKLIKQTTIPTTLRHIQKIDSISLMRENLKKLIQLNQEYMTKFLSHRPRQLLTI